MIQLPPPAPPIDARSQEVDGNRQPPEKQTNDQMFAPDGLHKVSVYQNDKVGHFGFPPRTGCRPIELKERLSVNRRSKTSRTFSHRNVTCGDLNFRASRLREAQTFISDSWIRLPHKRTKPRRRLGERRSSYRQEDSNETPTASGSDRCERRYSSRQVDRILPRGRRSKREGYSVPEPITCTVVSSATQNGAHSLCHPI